MCTVTYIKHNNQYFFTSNRDENLNRQSALHPQKNVVGDFHLYYPKDPKGNGTWFCVKNNGSICILLNGAQKKHVSKGPYHKSRGLVVLELMVKQNIISGWDEFNLENIEPFTIIAFSDGKLNQLRWDGINKQTVLLNSDEAYIWSSATLYSDDMISQKKRMFKDFLTETSSNIDGDRILAFHSTTKKEDIESESHTIAKELVITKNITQCIMTQKDFTLSHVDLLTEEKTILNAETVVA